MITNPLEIPKDAVFICGNIKATSGSENPDFLAMEEKLTEKGFTVVNSIKIVHDDPRIQKQHRAASAVMCGLVVTLNDWASEDEARDLVTICRVMGKTITTPEALDRHLTFRHSNAS